MNMRPVLRFFILLPLFTWLSACVGLQSFTTAARPGETVALAIGWNKTLTRQNMTVNITPSSGPAIIYAPNDARVRAILNLYPDPASRAVVGYQTGQALGGGGASIGSQIANRTYNASTEESDPDYWQTTVYLDLPTTLPEGPATITITGGTDAPLNPTHIDILPGSSVKNMFSVYAWDSADSDTRILPSNALTAMERAAQFTVTFSGTTIPHSIQFQFSHTPLVGKTWIVNPRGDLKNVLWTDNGSNAKVILTPTSGITLSQMIDFKFYISGGVSGVNATTIKAYDANGNPVIGITANID